MNVIYKFLLGMKSTNSIKDKISILKQHSNHPSIYYLLKYTYDKTNYQYGVSGWRIDHNPDTISIDINTAIGNLINITSKYSGNELLSNLSKLFSSISNQDYYILNCILDRDLKIGITSTTINKVFKNLIPKPPYMRCSLYSSKTISKISYPAFVQRKCDGTYRSVIVNNSKVTILTRNGYIDSSIPVLNEKFSVFPNGVYIGELLLFSEPNRMKANGILNSNNVPQEDVYIVLWDYIPLEDWYNPKQSSTIYKDRYSNLKDILFVKNIKQIQLVETGLVSNLNDVIYIAKEWISKGYEGAILKDFNNLFRNHTSPTQIKLKPKFTIDVIVTGYKLGNPNTKRENKVASLTFQSSDNLLTGSVSNFTDIMLSELNNNLDKYINKIMEIEGSGLLFTDGKYSILHPRFIEFRPDKDSPDDINIIKENWDMRSYL